MGINSIGAYKLSAIVSRILKEKKKLSFLNCFYVLFIVLFDDIHFRSVFLKVKGMRTVQMFFEDCMAST